MNPPKFYDSHCHVMNLSHPNLLAFLQRLNVGWTLALAPLAPVISVFGKKKLNNLKNLLSVMENDLGTLFLMMEQFLIDDPTLWENGSLKIGGNLYSKIVFTPLLMDFGYKGRTDPGIYYNLPSQKPIVDQVCDIFNGIRKYCEESEYQLFEIYPFLGLNTQNYFLADETSEIVSEKPNMMLLPETLRSKLKYNETYSKLIFFGEMSLDERNNLTGIFKNNPDKHAIRLIYDKSQKIAKRNTLQKMLDKYFSEYHSLQSELSVKMGQFDGDIKKMDSNYFAGIKVYPPLGFDPWPEGDEEELAKVKLLYQYCTDKKIPITSHCNSGGFVVVDRKTCEKYTSPERWAKVLEHYPNLRLNLAHFGKQDKKMVVVQPEEWTKQIIKLIGKYDHLYVDFSFNGLDEAYYKDLKRYIKNCPLDFREKLKKRILFGSDFMINLTGAESYNKYLQIYSESPYFSAEEKNLFSSRNAERFVFGEARKMERMEDIDRLVAVMREG